MGVAIQIISLVFGLSLGAIAVAAVALGIGGREIASSLLKNWFNKTKNHSE